MSSWRELDSAFADKLVGLGIDTPLVWANLLQGEDVGVDQIAAGRVHAQPQHASHRSAAAKKSRDACTICMQMKNKP